MLKKYFVFYLETFNLKVFFLCTLAPFLLIALADGATRGITPSLSMNSPAEFLKPIAFFLENLGTQISYIFQLFGLDKDTADVVSFLFYCVAVHGIIIFIAFLVREFFYSKHRKLGMTDDEIRIMFKEEGRKRRERNRF